MKQVITFIALLLLCSSSQAQKLMTRNARITFYSKNVLENIEATNNEVSSILDEQKGQVAFIALIKSFKFRKALMEEHFNEDYMESNTYPKASFNGTISDPAKVNYTTDGAYAVTVKGALTIHGVTKNIEVPANIVVTSGKVSANTTFNIQLKDYNIKVPSMYVKNIAETIQISVDCKY
jgi:hypothetical protein